MADDWDVDAELVSRCRAGERSACEELFERHVHSVIRFFRTKTLRQDVEDLVQESWTRAMSAMPGIRNGRLFRAFLMGIAQNVLREYIRTEARNRGLEFDEDRGSIADVLPEAGNSVEGRNEVKLLLAGLRRLPLEHQIIIEQHYFEGISIVELAEREKVSDSTMRSRLATARKMLAANIRELEASSRLIESTIERLDDWMADIRKILEGEGENDRDDDDDDDDDEHQR